MGKAFRPEDVVFYFEGRITQTTARSLRPKGGKGWATSHWQDSFFTVCGPAFSMKTILTAGALHGQDITT